VLIVIVSELTTDVHREVRERPPSSVWNRVNSRVRVSPSRPSVKAVLSGTSPLAGCAVGDGEARSSILRFPTMMETSRLKKLWAEADKADKEWMKNLFNFDLSLEVRQRQLSQAKRTMETWTQELKRVEYARVSQWQRTRT
jgi:hypothetical protein